MVDCDYCTESFDGEDAYLDHLAESHEGELGAIDQRRVSGRTGDDEGGVSVGVVAIGVIVLLTLGVGVYVTQLAGGGGGGADGIEASSLDASGDQSLLAGVEQFPNEGTDHVAEGTDVEYAQSPPLSGPHYSRAAEGGYYESAQPAGNIVHALEHGAVVIYYDPGANGTAAGTDDTVDESLREFAAANTGRWRSVIVVPNPAENPESDYVLTAWRTRLYMDSYDARIVHAFLSEFLGRGPENPVR